VFLLNFIGAKAFQILHDTLAEVIRSHGVIHHLYMVKETWGAGIICDVSLDKRRIRAIVAFLAVRV
jgi:hypothetical protein